MREIKFRAWVRRLDKMCNVTGIDFERNEINILRPGWHMSEWFRRDQVELMQYTGLKDINGKPIYEGDVVSFGSVLDNGDNEDLDEEIHIGVVEYDPHYAVYNVNCEESGERRFLLMDVVNYDGFGVIGNIHENPELLEAIE